MRLLRGDLRPHQSDQKTALSRIGRAKEAATKQLIEASNWLKEDANKARSIIAVQMLEEIVNTDD